MKIATWNVNGIRARQLEVEQFVARNQPDVVCLQEIKASPDQVPMALCEMEGYWCYWHGHKGYSGVGLHLRKESFPEKPEFRHPDFDHETRIVSAESGDLVLASIYVPNGGKDFPAKMHFLESLDRYVAQLHDAGRRVILCGDLNVARTDRDVHPRERKPGLIGQRPDERELIERIIGRGVVDVGRALDPDNDELFTWWAPWRNMRQRNIGWRLDYVMASEPIARRAASCSVLAQVGTSDHAPVLALFGNGSGAETSAGVAPAGSSG
ncbi:MAG: exodeoxyribonuclease III [Thermoanaerobaculia bacterium]|nr:exodeoxyribonuclease III [Thermoanaerobaculia bacterium]